MAAVVGVNGINTHGAGNIDLILSRLERKGIPVVDVSLPKRHFISARWGGRSDGEIVAESSQDGDILVCHSFGAVRSWYAHKHREFAAIVCIAPAHSKRAEWRNPSRVWCYYSPHDWVVRVGSRLLAFHPFGAAGIEGYNQLQPLGHNICMRSDHDDYFRGGMLATITKHLEHLWELQSSSPA